MTHRAISGSPPTAWSRSARKSRCDEADDGSRDGRIRIGKPLPVGHVASEPGHLPLGITAGVRLFLFPCVPFGCGTRQQYPLPPPPPPPPASQPPISPHRLQHPHSPPPP